MFLGERSDCAGRSWSSIRQHFHREGYAVFTSCTLAQKPGLLDNLEQYVRRLNPRYKGYKRGYGGRVQDGWKSSMAVRYAAADHDTLELLAYLHSGSSAVEPFQTLNFKRGTQQPTHSDVVHFDTAPRRAQMAASWIALENIHVDAGPLVFYPRSHAKGLWDYTQLELWNSTGKDYFAYERAVEQAIAATGMQPAYATIPRGTSFVWAASLLHGGSRQNNPNRTRLSQVTHYWMSQPGMRYWVPRYSPPGKREYAKARGSWAGLANVAAQVSTNASFWKTAEPCRDKCSSTRANSTSSTRGVSVRGGAGRGRAGQRLNGHRHVERGRLEKGSGDGGRRGYRYQGVWGQSFTFLPRKGGAVPGSRAA